MTRDTYDSRWSSQLGRYTAAHQRADYYHGPLSWYRFPSDGPALVLIHGLASRSLHWADLPLTFQHAGFDTLCIDLPGHGESTLADTRLDPVSMSEAVEFVMTACGHDSAHLVGHSLGGGVSLGFAHNFPEKLDSLTLVASGGLGTKVPLPLRAATLPGSAQVLTAALNPVSLRALKSVSHALDAVGVHPYELSEGPLWLLEQMAHPDRMRGFTLTARSVMSLRGQVMSGRAALENVSPESVTFVTCRQDPVIDPQDSIGAQLSLPGSSLLVIDGNSHEPHHQDRYAFVQAVLDNTRHGAGAHVGAHSAR